MLFDKNLILSGTSTVAGITGQAVDLPIGTAYVNSTNVIDLMQNRDLAACGDLRLYIKSTADAVGVDAAVRFNIRLIATDTDVDATVGDNLSIGETGPHTTATFNAKGEFILNISPDFSGLGKRYLMLKYSRGNNTAASCTVFAAMVLGVNIRKTYPAGYTII